MVEALRSSGTGRTFSSVSRAADVRRFRNGGRRNVGLRLLIVCACVALVGVFVASAVMARKDTLELTCLPIAPREGHPILLHLTLSNAGLTDEDYAFSVYVNGGLLVNGRKLIPAQSSRTISYIISVNIPVGQSLKIFAEAQALGSLQRYEERVQIPPVPPEIWSSFSSFASFSTSLLGYITTFSYYMSFAIDTSVYGFVNEGAMLTMALLVLLVFLQVSDPSWRILGARTLSLRTRYAWLAAALLATFAAMVFTRIILIITGLG